MATVAAAARTVAPSTQILKQGLPSIPNSSLNPYAPVAKWILSTSALVAGMVHVGGVTRLTKSGLSMTDWKPLGSLPPMTPDEWRKEFDRYKTFPEYQQRKSMEIDEFKFIYFWEYGHRMLGRFVGVCFAAPWVYFALKGRIPPGYKGRMGLLFAMGGTQGLVGWWMVRSGLGEDRRGDRKEIRVSPYRLATHLGMAFGTYGMLLWTGLGILQFPNDVSEKSKLRSLAGSLGKEAVRHATKLRAGALGVTGLTAITAMSGAFVAGNDAGNAYNTFPLMDGKVIPLDDMIDPNIQPAYRNLFENTAMVQWHHRLLGMSTAAGALALAGAGLFHPVARVAVTPQVRQGLQFIGAAAVGQVSLGIATLLSYVPIGLAAGHQLGSLVVLSSGIHVIHSLRYASPAILRAAGGNATSSMVKRAVVGVTGKGTRQP